MLTLMRSLLRSKVGFIVFGLVIIAMAGWGITDVFSGGLGNNLIGAGNRVVSDQQFDTTVERILRNQTDDRGRSLTKEQALEQGLIDRIFQQQQIDVALRAYGDKVGVTATKGAVVDSLTENSMFHDTTGVFDPNQYRALLNNNGLTPKEYQDNLEGTLTITRLQRLPVAGLKVPNVLARMDAAYTGEMRNARWFALPASALPEIGDPTDEDLQTLYDDRRDALREPERRSVSLIRLSPDDFLARAEIEEADIESFYEAYKVERYTGADSRTFSTFQFETEDAARAALGQIAGGADPASIEGLTDSNQSTGKAESIANATLSDQVFARSAQVNGIFGPQQIGNLWTVIRLEAIIPGPVTPLELVRDSIVDELKRQEAVGYYYDSLPQFDDLIGTGASLEDIAAGLGVPLLSFDAVDRNGFNRLGGRYTPLLEQPDLLVRIFERPVGSNTERFADDEVTWMARLDAIQEERVPEFEEVREVLDFAWRQGEAARQLQDAAAAVEDSVRNGEKTLAEAAQDYDRAVQTPERALTRLNYNEATLPPALINGLFEARNEGDLMTSPGLPGEMIILEVTEIDRPEPETLDLLASTAAVNMQGRVAEDLYQAYFAEIQRETELEINDSALAAYKRSVIPQQ